MREPLPLAGQGSQGSGLRAQGGHVLSFRATLRSQEAGRRAGVNDSASDEIYMTMMSLFFDEP